MADKRPALGRGLSALIPDAPAAALAPRDRAPEIDTDLLQPNPFQPRTEMNDERIEELARSIRSHGIIQPIVVRRAGDHYQIIAGERRWRAAQRAGLLKVPVVVRDVPDSRLLAVALIENIQREDLNPIEEATAYRRLADELQLTQDQIADAVGKDRSSIANYVRLLRLPQEVRASVASSAISMGHARALLALPDEASQLRVGREIVARSLSVRDVEALVKRTKDTKDAKDSKDTKDQKDPNTRAAEDTLRLKLGTRVRIKRRGRGGRIEIDFMNEDELQRIYERLSGD